MKKFTKRLSLFLFAIIHLIYSLPCGASYVGSPPASRDPELEILEKYIFLPQLKEDSDKDPNSSLKKDIEPLPKDFQDLLDEIWSFASGKTLLRRIRELLEFLGEDMERKPPIRIRVLCLNTNKTGLDPNIVSLTEVNGEALFLDNYYRLYFFLEKNRKKKIEELRKASEDKEEDKEIFFWQIDQIIKANSRPILFDPNAGASLGLLEFKLPDFILFSHELTHFLLRLEYLYFSYLNRDKAPTNWEADLRSLKVKVESQRITQNTRKMGLLNQRPLFASWGERELLICFYDFWQEGDEFHVILGWKIPNGQDKGKLVGELPLLKDKYGEDAISWSHNAYNKWVSLASSQKNNSYSPREIRKSLKWIQNFPLDFSNNNLKVTFFIPKVKGLSYRQILSSSEVLQGNIEEFFNSSRNHIAMAIFGWEKTFIPLQEDIKHLETEEEINFNVVVLIGPNGEVFERN